VVIFGVCLFFENLTGCVVFASAKLFFDHLVVIISFGISFVMPWLNFSLLESLILAQDERWRRA
jgi:hypothetical protein